MSQCLGGLGKALCAASASRGREWTFPARYRGGKRECRGAPSGLSPQGRSLQVARSVGWPHPWKPEGIRYTPPLRSEMPKAALAGNYGLCIGSWYKATIPRFFAESLAFGRYEQSD